MNIFTIFTKEFHLAIEIDDSFVARQSYIYVELMKRIYKMKPVNNDEKSTNVMLPVKAFRGRCAKDLRKLQICRSPCSLTSMDVEFYLYSVT